MCGWQIANGNNNSHDLRGFTLAMATNIPSSYTLYGQVDPVLNGDADMATNIGDIKGRAKIKLTANQSGLRAHNHGVTDLGHNHANGNFNRLMQHTGLSTVNSNDNNDLNGREPALNDSQPMSNSITNISINNNTAQDAIEFHENRQPTKYFCAIQRMF